MICYAAHYMNNILCSRNQYCIRLLATDMNASKSILLYMLYFWPFTTKSFLMISLDAINNILWCYIIIVSVISSSSIVRSAALKCIWKEKERGTWDHYEKIVKLDLRFYHDIRILYNDT
jgi:hypothetical protein